MPQPGSGRKRRKELEIIPSGYGPGGPFSAGGEHSMVVAHVRNT